MDATSQRRTPQPLEGKYGSRRFQQGGRQLDRAASKAAEVDDDGERNYEELGARLERMKGVVQNLHAEVANLTNKMGGFMNLPASTGPKYQLARLMSAKAANAAAEAEKRSENTLFIQPGVIDSPSTTVREAQRDGPICHSPRKSEGMRESHVYTPTPSPEPRHSIESSEADSPHRPGTPVRTPVSSPRCRSLPRSTGSPDALCGDDFCSGRTWEGSQGSDSEYESDGNPWGHPPAKFVELVRQLQLGNLPESVLKTYDTTRKYPPPPIPPRTEPVPPKPWEGKIKLGIEAAGFSSSAKSTNPMRKDSPIPQTGLYIRTRICSRSSSRSRIAARDQEKKSRNRGSPIKKSIENSAPVKAFVFGRNDI